ncbi:MAG: hypothetical protein JJU03_00870 [Idiomarina sp.]|nr:hypothetical protein [Idiomarina sp.]
MKALAALLLCVPCAVFAGERNTDSHANLTIYGTIQPNCEVYLNGNHPLARPMEELRYNMASPQIVAEVVIACNHGGETVNVTYESMNGGMLSPNGMLLDYEKSLSGGRETNLASSGPWTISQRVGPRSQFLRIRPLSRGAIEGSYSDVILVSVSLN